MRIPKERVIYDNYDLWGSLADVARERLEEANYNNDLEEDPSENEIWEEIYFYDRINWSDAIEDLKQWFVGYQYMIRGYVGRWNGTFAAGTVFTDIEKAIREAITDCDYIKIWDENGHFYLKCSHHDGTNLFEIKKIRPKGSVFLEKWECDFEDPRTEEEIHSIIWNSNFLSALPHFAAQMYGCKRREYITK